MLELQEATICGHNSFHSIKEPGPATGAEARGPVPKRDHHRHLASSSSMKISLTAQAQLYFKFHAFEFGLRAVC